MTRYADDIVFSGKGEFPEDLRVQFLAIFENQPWKLAERKTNLASLPNRLKVHGLLVHGDTIRLTKGYRNKLRAYEHLLAIGKIGEEDFSRITGFISYAKFVQKAATLDLGAE